MQTQKVYFEIAMYNKWHILNGLEIGFLLCWQRFMNDLHAKSSEIIRYFHFKGLFTCRT